MKVCQSKLCFCQFEDAFLLSSFLSLPFFPVLISHVVKSVAFIRFNYSVGSLPLFSDSFNVLSLSLTLLVSVYCACMPWCLSSSVECSRLSLWKFPLSALYLVYSPCCLTFSPCIFFFISNLHSRPFLWIFISLSVYSTL